MKNTKELNIFITIVLILICSYIICSLMIKKRIYWRSSKRFNRNSNRFYSVHFKGRTYQACIDRCMNPNDRQGWGGDL